MKKQYEMPKMEVVEFETVDVIGDSGLDFTLGDNETELDGVR
jgi:hypothetical protein